MSRPVISLILGVIMAAVALFVVYSARGGDVAVAAPTVVTIPTTEVLIANVDIEFGSRLVEEMVTRIDWPNDALPEDIINDQDVLLTDAEGPRIALRSFVKGEPFLKAKVSGFGQKPTLSRKVAEGMRAVAIRINDVNGVAGFLLPGDRVDVLLTRDQGGRGENRIVDVILQNISVLGIDQLASEEAETPVLARTATVEVTPEDAQKLALAQQVGSLSLALRNFTNNEEAEVKRIDLSDLGDKKQVARQDNGIYVRVRKGSDVSSERVPK